MTDSTNSAFKRPISSIGGIDDSSAIVKTSRTNESSSSPQKPLAPLFAKRVASSSLPSGEWRTFDSCLYRHHVGYATPCGLDKVLGLDMDGTVIKTRSGNTFPKDEHDWEFLSPAVPRTLKSYYEMGYYLVLISNQSTLAASKANFTEKRKSLKRKVDAVVAALQCPIDFICSTANDIYRKPRRGMWEAATSLRGLAILPSSDYSASIYVGDAAGRPASGSHKKDFAASDLLFALNVRCAFKTPESFFLGSTHDRDTVFDVSRYPRIADLPAGVYPEHVLHPSEDALELVVLVGTAASGKSTLARLMASHVRVNQDALGSQPACVAKVKQELLGGRSVVVDNTNLTKTVRASYIKLALECKAKARCIRLCTSKATVHLLRSFRELNPHTLAEDRRAIPEVVINSHFSKLEEPSTDEGFAAVDRIDFAPIPPEQPAAASLFSQYLD